MPINYQNLKKALQDSVDEYKKKYFTGFHLMHGKSGKLRASKLEKLITIAGDNELSLLLLACAVINIFGGTKLQELIRDAIIKGHVFDKGEYTQAFNNHWAMQCSTQAPNVSCGVVSLNPGSTGLAKSGAVYDLLWKALGERKLENVDVNLIIQNLRVTLNERKKSIDDIDPEPFGNAMGQFESKTLSK
jgi:hypothetical protein